MVSSLIDTTPIQPVAPATTPITSPRDDAGTKHHFTHLHQLIENGVLLPDEAVILDPDTGKLYWRINDTERVALSETEELVLREKMKERVLERIQEALETFMAVYEHDDELYAKGVIIPKSDGGSNNISGTNSSSSSNATEDTKESFTNALSVIIQPDSIINAIQERLPFVPLQSLLTSPKTQFVWKNPIVLGAATMMLRKMNDLVASIAEAGEKAWREKKVKAHGDLVEKVVALKEQIGLFVKEQADVLGSNSSNTSLSNVKEVNLKTDSSVAL